MEAQQRKFIHYHFNTLVEKLDIDLLMPYLYCQDVLTSYDVELLNFPGWDCRRMKAIDLCHLIARRGAFAFSKFMIGLSILQPDLFKLLCEDNGTTMGPWLRELERYYLEELEKEKQSALMEGVNSASRMEINSDNTVDADPQSIASPTEASFGETHAGDMNIPNGHPIHMKLETGEPEDVSVENSQTGQYNDEIDVPVIQMNADQLSPPSSPVNPEDRGIPTKSNIAVEDNGGEQEITHGLQPVIQGGQGLVKSKTKSYDIGPDEIRIKGEPEVKDSDSQLTPRTVFPLSLRRYALPARLSDGTKVLHLKTVRSPGTRRRVMITLTLNQWKRVVETMDITLQVQSMVTREHKDISVCVHLGHSVFMILCPTYGNVEILRYIGRGVKHMAIPTQDGIVLSPREWRRLVSYRRKIKSSLLEQEIEQEEEEEHNEHSHCYLAGRHEKFLGPLKCPDCGYQAHVDSNLSS